MTPSLPKSINRIGFTFIFIAIFLIFFNNFLGFEGALGIVLIFTLFVRFFLLKGCKTTLSRAEKWFALSVFFYIAMIIISTLINAESFDAGQKVLNKYNKIIYFIGFVYLLKFIKFDLKSFEIFIMIMAYAIFFMIALELFQFGLWSHLGGFYSNKGTGAWFFSTIMISTFFLAINKLQNIERTQAIHYLLLSLGLLLIIIFSSTRSIWFGLFVTALIMLPVMFRSFPILTLLKSKYFWLFLISFALLFALSSDKLEKRFSDAKNDIQMMSNGDYDSSLGLRLVMYNIGFEGFKESKWQGLGESNFKPYLKNLYEVNKGTDKEQIYLTITSFKQIHNQFLMDAWMKGIFGLLSLIFLFLVPLWFFIKELKINKTNIIPLIGISFLINSFVFFQFGAVLTYSHGIVFFIIWLVLLISVLSNSRNQEFIKTPD